MKTEIDGFTHFKSCYSGKEAQVVELRHQVAPR